MPKRKTVKLDINNTKKLIKKVCRSNVVFCERMEKHSRWVSDWGKMPTPKNLPSPEEAARMCVILQVKPEEILTDQGDIELVYDLLESQKKPLAQGEELSEVKKKLIQKILERSDEDAEFMLQYIERMK